MTFWEKIYSFFQEKDTPLGKPNGQSIPIAEGILKRSPEEIDHYMQWKFSPSKQKILQYIADNYKVWEQKPCEQCDCIDFHKAAAFRGFIVHFSELGWGCDEVRHLMDYLKEQVLGSGYRISLSDYKEIQKTRWIERREKHYLKPRLEYDEHNRQIQRYGNVSIEAILRSNEPMQLRFSACYYNDRNFTEPWEFNALMESITA